MITEKAKEILREELKKHGVEEQMEWHFQLVHDYAMKLMEKHGGDKEIIELAVWLHDITRITGRNEKEWKDHHLTGAEEAGKILKELGYPDDRIKQVQHCIREHNTGRKPETIEAKIISVADALSHFDMVPYFMWLRGSRKIGLDNSLEWVSNKLKKDWEGRFDQLEGSKELVKEKYEAFKILWGEK
jgi:HD superfamily phosphohydrolase YqeK